MTRAERTSPGRLTHLRGRHAGPWGKSAPAWCAALLAAALFGGLGWGQAAAGERVPTPPTPPDPTTRDNAPPPPPWLMNAPLYYSFGPYALDVRGPLAGDADRRETAGEPLAVELKIMEANGQGCPGARVSLRGDDDREATADAYGRLRILYDERTKPRVIDLDVFCKEKTGGAVIYLGGPLQVDIVVR